MNIFNEMPPRSHQYQTFQKSSFQVNFVVQVHLPHQISHFCKTNKDDILSVMHLFFLFQSNTSLQKKCKVLTPSTLVPSIKYQQLSKLLAKHFLGN